MAAIALFHSVYGLRSLERDAAARLRAAGHQVVTPDLYEGRVGSTLEEGFALRKEIGWAELCGRAEKAIADLPASAVLGGFSMLTAMSTHHFRAAVPISGNADAFRFFNRYPEDIRFDDSNAHDLSGNPGCSTV